MNVKDAEYVRPLAAFLFILIVFLQNIRVPGMTMICAAGHFKETQPQAIREAAINLVVSLLLVKKFGMVGVLFGTVCSYGYRSIEIILYNRKYLVLGSGKKTWQRIIRNTLVALIIGVIGYKVIPVDMLSYTQWFLYAIIFGIISSCFTIGINYIFEPEEFRELIVRVFGIIKKDNNV